MICNKIFSIEPKRLPLSTNSSKAPDLIRLSRILLFIQLESILSQKFSIDSNEPLFILSLIILFIEFSPIFFNALNPNLIENLLSFSSIMNSEKDLFMLGGNISISVFLISFRLSAILSGFDLIEFNKEVKYSTL